MAQSISLAKFAKATDLKKRLWFTIGALIVFRLLSYVPLPGVDPTALGLLSQKTTGGVLDFFNTFSGGSLSRMSLIALGVMPYITASIVVQLATSLSPQLAAIKKEGESGRKKLNQYTRYGTVLLTAIQGYFIAVGLETLGASQGIQAVIEPGMTFRIAAVISLIGGTMFLMWLGEQITSRGIGNGVSLIIMAGIVAHLPTTLVNLLEGGRTGSIDPVRLIGIIVAVVVLVLFICFMERAQRRILIQYPKRATQRGMQADRSHLPLKINTAGVIPPIFASSLLLMPLTISQFAGQRVAGESRWGDFIISLNPVSAARLAGLHAAVRRGHHLLLVLLHRGRLQPGRDGGQPQALWRLHSRHPSGQEHRDLSGLCADPHHGDRRGVPDDHLSAARISGLGAPDSLLSGRHQPADRRQRDDGHGDADSKPLARASIWRSDQEGEAERRSSALIARTVQGIQGRVTWA
ncbi:preprotein translocase SecY subunit [Sphingomonas sp. SORGH_AS 879]|nr:preprotein translocase SecY subunit [Sphingomonas sp. SORGH_AS_0879]